MIRNSYDYPLKQELSSDLEEKADSRFMRNSGKVLLTGAGAIGAAGGFMYINGRMLQSSDKGARNK